MFWKKSVLSAVCVLCASALLAGCGAAVSESSLPEIPALQSQAEDAAPAEAETAQSAEETAAEQGEPAADETSGGQAEAAQPGGEESAQSAASTGGQSGSPAAEQTVSPSSQQSAAPSSSSQCAAPSSSQQCVPSSRQEGTASAWTNGGSSGAPSSPVSAEEYRQEVFRLVNEERAKQGLAAYGYCDELQAAADLRAQEIVSAFSHTRPDGRSCFTVFDDLGVTGLRAMGENIAYGQRTPAEVMNGWMNSAGHRANILSGDFNGIVIGYYNYRWVQLFVRK